MINGKEAYRPGEMKGGKKHGNRNKKEKSRRLYQHLDKHDSY